MEQTPKKRGRPAKIKETPGIIEKPINPTPSQIVEIIREVPIIREVFVEKTQLEGFELYKALKDKGFTQGGQGQYQEDMNGIEKVYIPHASEIYQSFAQNPEGWDIITKHLARAYLEINK